jgi:hypothetical protein
MPIPLKKQQAMSYKLKYDKEQDLIIGRVEGNIDKVLVQQMAGEFARLVMTTGCEKLLNDLRSAIIEHSLTNIWEMPKIVCSKGVPLRCKRALVMDKTSGESASSKRYP